MLIYYIIVIKYIFTIINIILLIIKNKWVSLKKEKNIWKK